MTNRIYYTDAYAREFDATVVDTLAIDGADGRTAVILDRTAFYPTSGGQPFDTGALGDARVIDVVDRDDGTVLHVIEGAVGSGPVRGWIDWDRRFEHMQQHTGQHVLSAAFDRACQARTESFHLGTTAATIDLAREVSPAEIAAAELTANQIVWDDRRVHVRFVDEREAAALPLRKDPARTGRLRIVEVEGFDLSACGGTHVSATGAIGNISVTASERFRGGTRVEFRCGIRTLRGYRALRDATVTASRLLSTSADDLPAAVERLQTEQKETRRRVKDLQEKLAHHEAERLASEATVTGAGRIAFAVLDGWDAGGLKTIAAAIAQRPGHGAVLVAGPRPLSIAVARAAGVSLDANAMVKAITAKFGGKGGGKPELAQAGGLDADTAAVTEYARTLC